MTYISVYDLEAKQMEQLCEEYGTTEPKLMEALLNAVAEGEIKLSDWL